MLDTRTDALEICICKLCYSLYVLYPVDVLADLLGRSRKRQLPPYRFGLTKDSNTSTHTLLAVISQLASLSFLKSMRATGTCQSWTAGGLAAN